jgi:hypothetical protein
MLNPYASQLGDLDPLEAIAATPAKLRALMDAIEGERPGSHVRRASSEEREPSWPGSLSTAKREAVESLRLSPKPQFSDGVPTKIPTIEVATKIQ